VEVETGDEDSEENSTSSDKNEEQESEEQCTNQENDSTQKLQVSTKSQASKVQLLKTSCGDSHNLGLDKEGLAYVLPSPLTDWGPLGPRHKVTDVVAGKEHCLLLTEHGQVYSWGGGSRGQLGHGSLLSEEKPRLVMALDGMRIRKIAAGGWHSACISQFDDLYMFGWNESGQLAQPSPANNLAKPAECFSAVEKLFMACCTMQPEDDAALPRSDGDPADDQEVYHKNNEDEISTVTSRASMSFCGIAVTPSSGATGNNSNLIMSCGGGGRGSGTAGDRDNPLMSFTDIAADPADISFEKDDVTCYRSSCNYGDTTDLITVQSLPMLVSLPTPATGASSGVADVDCGSRHTVVLTKGVPEQLWAFGWNKYGQLGLGHNTSKDAPEKMVMPRLNKGRKIKMVKAGDWGTAVITTPSSKNTPD